MKEGGLEAALAKLKSAMNEGRPEPRPFDAGEVAGLAITRATRKDAYARPEDADQMIAEVASELGTSLSAEERNLARREIRRRMGLEKKAA